MEFDLAMKIVELKKEEVLEAVARRAGRGEDPLAVLNECRQGMALIGERFQKGDYYLAELVLSAEIFNQVTETLKPYLEMSRPAGVKGKVVLATLRGDVHDLGKNIFASFLRAHGFEVCDLGVDVAPSVVVEKVKEFDPEFVGFSALITLAFQSMKETVDMLVREGLRDQFKLMLGGGVTSRSLKDYIGADFQTLDAMEGVVYCLQNCTKGGDGHAWRNDDTDREARSSHST